MSNTPSENATLKDWEIRSQFTLEEWKAKTLNDLEAWKGNKEWQHLSSELAINFATVTIKALLLINGGAVVALLAFLGKIWSPDNPASPTIVPAIAWFLGGTICAVMVGCSSYFAQSFFTHYKNKIGIGFQVFAILIGICSLGCFGTGAFKACDSFTNGFKLPLSNDIHKIIPKSK